MKLRLEKLEQNIVTILRSIGYHPDRFQKKEELSFSRSLLSDRYPRFHIYYNEKKKEINLHLDHKAPKYNSAPDHGAEYNGKLVEKEMEKIKKIFTVL
jgi:hypothetical protein